MPIARDTLSGLSGVGRASQRAYEERAGVKVQANFSIGTVSTKESKEDGAWSQGRALFELNRLSRPARQAGENLSGLTAVIRSESCIGRDTGRETAVLTCGSSWEVGDVAFMYF